MPQTIEYAILRPPNRITHFRAHLLSSSRDRIVVSDTAHLDRPMHIGDDIVLDSGYTMVWFLYRHQPWDIGRFYRPDGHCTGIYVDVLEPVRWDDADPPKLEPIVDLFLDLWIDPRGEVRVLDQDEFEAAIVAGYVDARQQRHALETLQYLQHAIDGGTFPPADVRVFDLGAPT